MESEKAMYMGVTKHVRAKSLVLAVVILLALAGMRALFVRYEIQYYEPKTGMLRRVLSYQLAGVRPRVTLFTLRDKAVPTEVSAYLLSRGEKVGDTFEWIMINDYELGLDWCTMGNAVTPGILLHYRGFEMHYKPLLSDAEYLALVRLTLDPKDCQTANRLLDYGFLRQMEEVEDSRVRRRLIDDEIGELWSKYLADPGAEQD